MKIQVHIDINAPAEDVWTVIGPGFADVGRWVTTIPRSSATAHGEGRVCAVDAMPGIEEVVERLTNYDDAEHTLTYVADAGLPGYVLAAQNTWSVRPLGPDGCRALMTAELQLSGAAVLAGPAVRLALTVTGRRTLRDLKHLIEVGVPTRRKQQQLARQAFDERSSAEPGDGRPAARATPVVMQVQRIIAAPAEQVWEAVADAADYARFAAGIAETQIVTGAGVGMVRSCTDDHGGTWSETCTLWEEGQRYRMTVDTATYPRYYRALIHELHQTWLIEPVAGGTRLTLTFEGRMKLGIIGRGAARIMGRTRRLEAILEAYEAAITASRSGGQDAQPANSAATPGEG